MNPRPTTLDDLYLACLAKSQPYLQSEVLVELIDRLRAVETITARLAELAGGSNQQMKSRSDAGEYPTASAVGSTNNQPTKD